MTDERAAAIIGGVTTALDLIRELQADPALAAAVRGALLGDELLGLPAAFARMAEAQALMAEALGRLEQQMERLSEAQTQTEAALRDLASLFDRELAVVRSEAAEFRTEVAGEFAAVRSEMAGEFAAVRSEAAEFRTEVDGQIKAVQSQFKAVRSEAADFRREMDAQFASVRAGTDDLRDDFRDFRSEVGRMRDRMGSTEEEEAGSGLLDALEALGYRIEDAPASLRFDGHEIDVVVRALDPDGPWVSALAEAKIRLGVSDVRRFSDRVHDRAFLAQLAAAGFGGPWLAYVYGMRVEQRVVELARTTGVGLLGAKGGPARVDAVAIQP